jgi:hypothetical protein
MTDYFVVEPCASSNGFEIKLKGKRIDIKKAEQAVSVIGETKATSPIVMLSVIKGYQVSVYASGRLMVKSEERMSEEDATKLAKEIMSAFEKSGAII